MYYDIWYIIKYIKYYIIKFNNRFHQYIFNILIIYVYYMVQFYMMK